MAQSRGGRRLITVTGLSSKRGSAFVLIYTKRRIDAPQRGRPQTIMPLTAVRGIGRALGVGEMSGGQDIVLVAKIAGNYANRHTGDNPFNALVGKTALVAASPEVTRIKVGRRSDRSKTKNKA
jgi:hypothetical protein